MAIKPKKKAVKGDKKVKEKKKVDTVKGSKKTREKTIPKTPKKTVESLTEISGVTEEMREAALDGHKLSPEVQAVLDVTPSWYIDLFNYLHLFHELDIDVTKEATDSTNKKDIRFKARYLERQLFLIFECLPKTRAGVEGVIRQREFCKCAGITETVCGMWKKEEWFWGNRVRLMKRIFSLHTPDVIDALYKGSTTASWTSGQYDAKCIKLWLEYVEGFVSGIDLTSKGEGITIQFASGPSNFIQAPSEDEK